MILAGTAVSGLVAARAGMVALPAFAYSRGRTVVAALAAAVAVLAPGAPTGLVVVDSAMKALFAVVISVSVSRAPRATWLLSSAVAAVGSGSGGLAMVSFVLLGAAAAASAGPRWETLAAAAWGGVLAQVLLRLPAPAPVGATAVLAAIAAAMVVAGWYLNAEPASRRRARGAAGAVAGAAGVLLASVVVAGVLAGGHVRAGMDATTAGLEAAGAGELERAGDHFAQASTSLQRANQRLGAWWVTPARALPVVGRFLHDAREVTAVGAGVAQHAQQVAELSTSDELRVRDGGISLPGLDAVRRKLEDAVGSLEAGHNAIAFPSSDPWIPGPVQARLDRLGARLDRAVADAQNAAAAATVAPRLLGADGPRRWFLVVHTPAEQRGAGGVMGNYGELVANGGTVALGSFGRTRELNAPDAVGRRRLSPEVAASLARYDSFGITRYFQNAMQSPDFTVNARAIEELSAASGGPEVGGVVAIDPLGLAAILELTGPVTVPSWPRPIDTTNVREVLLHDQYVALEGEVREEFLGEVARTVVQALTDHELGSPAEIARAMGPALAGKHVMFHSAEPAEQEVLERLGVAGRMRPLDGGDFLQVVTQNTTETKIDWFLRRDVTYDVVYDPASGAVAAGLEVQLHNGAPAEGLPAYVIGSGSRPSADYPPPGYNRLWLSIYSPLALQGATVDGQAFVLSQGRELGRNVYSGLVTVPPGATSTVRLQLEGSITPARSYKLDVGAQPQAAPDRLSVHVRPAYGWERPSPPPPAQPHLSRRSPGATDDDRGAGGDVSIEVGMTPT